MTVNTYIGVDMAKHSFDVCFNDGQTIKTFLNTEVGITRMFREISKVHNVSDQERSTVYIGVESTSHYHLLLCMRAREEGYTPMLINPLITNKYAARNLRKAKTDKIDARVIQYCTMQGEGYLFTQTTDTLTIKHLIRDREYLAKLHLILTMRQASCDFKSSAIRQDIPSINKDIILQIKEKMKEVEKKLRQYCTQAQKLLQTIPGVGPLTAIACIAEVQDINKFKKASQLVAFIGIDPKVHQSGSSIDKYRRISKRGSTILRTRLYNATSVAVLRDNQFKTYFEKKRSEGKPYRVALVATMNKMTRVIHAVWTSGKPYQEP